MLPEVLGLLGGAVAPCCLYLARVGGVFVTAPGLNHAAVPLMVRVGLAVLVSVGLYGVKGGGGWSEVEPLVLVLVMVLEFGVGAVLGTMARLLLSVVEVAGEVVSFQMGFAAAALYDPTLGGSASPPTRLMALMALLLFLLVDGHHAVLGALWSSYGAVPVGGAGLGSVDFGLFFEVCGGLFGSAGQLAFPFVFVLLSINLVLGLLARFVPQINVFVLGFIFTIGLGLLSMIEFMPGFVESVLLLLSRLPELLRLSGS